MRKRRRRAHKLLLSERVRSKSAKRGPKPAEPYNCSAGRARSDAAGRAGGKASAGKDKGGIMEIKINREIREYTESVFFGLSLRQFVFSLCSVFAAVGLYFLLRPYLGTEMLSWLCILGAAPFAALGFVKYNGMSAEKFIAAWIRSEILMPKHLVFRPRNIYFGLMEDRMKEIV